jgi:3',5'-cyclic AMP phosphodiesterase CpdA
MTESITFAHISDTHIQPDGERRFGRSADIDLDKLIDTLADIPTHVDFVFHTGDIVNAGDDVDLDVARDAYLDVRRRFDRLKLPVYYACGNHDTSTLINDILLPEHISQRGDVASRVCYEFSFGQFSGFVLDARIDDGPVSRISDDQLQALDRFLSNSSPLSAVFLHFPCLATGTAWADPRLVMENGDELHAVLANHARQRSGSLAVFFGHIHATQQIVEDGVNYVCAASSAFGFPMWPGDVGFEIDDRGLRNYNLVTLSETRLHVRVCSYTSEPPRP